MPSRPTTRRTRAPGILLATALGAVAWHWARLWLVPAAPPDVRPLLPATMPAASAFADPGGTPPRRTALTPGPGGAPVPVGSVVSSEDLAPDVRGYAGKVPLLVGITPEGLITGVALLPNHETPSYAARLEQAGFLRQFAGRKATDPLLLDGDIDGVTRATVTAAAVVEGVRRSARAAARGIYGLPAPEQQPTARRFPGVQVAAIGCALGLGVISAMIPAAALRWAALLFSLGALGFWQSTYLSAVNLANALLWRWPAPQAHAGWYLLFGAAVSLALLWRNVYCSRLCPFGALQELVHALVPWRLGARPDEDRQARALRFVFLWLATLAVFGFGVAEAANYEPFSTAFDFQGGGLRRLLLAAILVFAAARHRPWCRYFCPTGACLQLLGRMKAANPFE